MVRVTLNMIKRLDRFHYHNTNLVVDAFKNPIVNKGMETVSSMNNV